MNSLALTTGARHPFQQRDMPAGRQSFDGSCHCGAVGFTFRTALAVSEWSVRACQCRFCRSHGALTTSDPAGSLSFRASTPELLNRYRFGMKTADFLLCRRCGVYVGAQIETDRGRFGIINLAALTTVLRQLPAATPADYAAESSSERARRREQRWTPLESDGSQAA